MILLHQADQSSFWVLHISMKIIMRLHVPVCFISRFAKKIRFSKVLQGYGANFLYVAFTAALVCQDNEVMTGGHGTAVS